MAQLVEVLRRLADVEEKSSGLAKRCSELEEGILGPFGTLTKRMHVYGALVRNSMCVTTVELEEEGSLTNCSAKVIRRYSSPRVSKSVMDALFPLISEMIDEIGAAQGARVLIEAYIGTLLSQTFRVCRKGVAAGEVAASWHNTALVSGTDEDVATFLDNMKKVFMLMMYVRYVYIIGVYFSSLNLNCSPICP